MFVYCTFRLGTPSFTFLQRINSLSGCSVIIKQHLKIHNQAVLTNGYHSYSSTLRLMKAFSSHRPTDLSKMHCFNDIHSIFMTAVESVLPRQMLLPVIRYSTENSTLLANDRHYHLAHNVYVVGFGKAVCGMARAVEDVIGEHVRTGIISIPLGAVEALKAANKEDMLLKHDSKIKIYEGAKNNLPDENALAAAKAIHELVSSLNKTDILIVLISGGGSALLPMPCESISLSDIMNLTSLLSRNGANISEMNAVRKNIEMLKGGGLAQCAYPAQVISLIVSDTIGNSLDDVASGPTVPNCSHPSQCFETFTRLGIMDRVPPSIVSFLKTKIKSQNAVIRDPKEIFCTGWEWVYNIVVGSNNIATAAAAKTAKDLGYAPYILSNEMEGEAKKVAAMFAKTAFFISLMKKRESQEHKALLRGLELDLVEAGIKKKIINEIVSVTNKGKNSGKPVCIISGGETTVHVKGSGIGGRNQEMVLAAAIHLDELFRDQNESEKQHVCFSSGGTDGQDGATDAAGAVVDANFVAQSEMDVPTLKAYLENNDSHSLFKMVKGGSYLIKPGLTGTNVMDIQILIVSV